MVLTPVSERSHMTRGGFRLGHENLVSPADEHPSSLVQFTLSPSLPSSAVAPPHPPTSTTAGPPAEEPSWQWPTLDDCHLGWLVAAFELLRQRIATHTEGKKVEPPPLWFAALFQPWVGPRRWVATHEEENGDNISEWHGLGLCRLRDAQMGSPGFGAGVGRHRRGRWVPWWGGSPWHGSPWVALLGVGDIGEMGCAVAPLDGIATASPEVALAGWAVAVGGEDDVANGNTVADGFLFGGPTFFFPTFRL
ncbi:hypothetical protein TIFTF001_017247 [Ficus carica]|uniref:Uncharacterized protein n=1 Tax=Ficus carica TaxID=3494 RepID=A0AA88AKV8_FICCA|nr:hypothetical protein TIFTF001_017247 [Ficus carica]